MNRAATLEGRLGGVAPPDQIRGSGGGKALGLAAIPIAARSQGGRTGSTGQDRWWGRAKGGSPEGNAPLGPTVAETGAAALGGKAVGTTASLKGGTAVIAAGAPVGATAALGASVLRAPAPLPVPAAIGGTVTTGLEPLSIAGGIGTAFLSGALRTAAGLGAEAAGIAVAARLGPGRSRPERAAGGPAEGAVGGCSAGTATGSPVARAAPTALGTAAGTAIRGLAHGVRGDGLGGSFFARWSSSSASRRGFRRKSHPSIVSNPVACP